MVSLGNIYIPISSFKPLLVCWYFLICQIRLIPNKTCRCDINPFNSIRYHRYRFVPYRFGIFIRKVKLFEILHCLIILPPISNNLFVVTAFSFFFIYKALWMIFLLGVLLHSRLYQWITRHKPACLKYLQFLWCINGVTLVHSF